MSSADESVESPRSAALRDAHARLQREHDAVVEKLREAELAAEADQGGVSSALEPIYDELLQAKARAKDAEREAQRLTRELAVAAELKAVSVKVRLNDSSQELERVVRPPATPASRPTPLDRARAAARATGRVAGRALQEGFDVVADTLDDEAPKTGCCANPIQRCGFDANAYRSAKALERRGVDRLGRDVVELDVVDEFLLVEVFDGGDAPPPFAATPRQMRDFLPKPLVAAAPPPPVAATATSPRVASLDDFFAPLSPAGSPEPEPPKAPEPPKPATPPRAPEPEPPAAPARSPPKPKPPIVTIVAPPATAKTPAVVKPKATKATPPVFHVIQPATPEDGFSEDDHEEDPRARKEIAPFSDPRKTAFCADPYEMDEGMDPRFPHYVSGTTSQ